MTCDYVSILPLTEWGGIKSWVFTIEIFLLFKVVSVMNQSTGETQQLASKILTELKQKDTSWTRVDGILEYSQLMETKYFALQILESLIETRWKTLPREQCEGIKKMPVFFKF